ncbi:MAG: D-sedoheptulose-7-phosphate isomerase [Planctomycetota bacterium]|jgi:D-sedoheptulose 7-phosphate isomerase
MDKKTKKLINATIETHEKMLAELKAGTIETIAAAAEMITDSLKQGGCVYICGNGGSAADAQHIAGELLGRFSRQRCALPAVALTTDTSVITSIANDYSYEDIFTRQVEALVGENDIFWAISTSGNSPNVVAATKKAKQKNAKILAFTGRADSELEKNADLCFCAPNESTARSQEIHQLAYHIICDLVEQSSCSE